MLPDNVAENLCRETFIFGLLGKAYFVKTESLTAYQKQTRQVIKIPRHGFFFYQGMKKT